MGGKDILHPNFFLLMDWLKRTLKERIQEWKTLLLEKKESRGLFVCKSLVPNNDFLQKKLEVDYNVASACEYMHLHKLIHWYDFSYFVHLRNLPVQSKRLPSQTTKVVFCRKKLNAWWRKPRSTRKKMTQTRTKWNQRTLLRTIATVRRFKLDQMKWRIRSLLMTRQNLRRNFNSSSSYLNFFFYFHI